NGELSLFRSDPYFEEGSLCHRFSRLAGLAVESEVIVAEMFRWGGVLMGMDGDGGNLYLL
ncbi:hypothetical protein A2U01_0069190, partial [Trifolium medium]|nr:hypothetical protein [Trifolium medium]